MAEKRLKKKYLEREDAQPRKSFRNRETGLNGIIRKLSIVKSNIQSGFFGQKRFDLKI